MKMRGTGVCFGWIGGKEQRKTRALLSSLLLLKRLYRVRSVEFWQSNTNPTLGCQGSEDVRRNVCSKRCNQYGGTFGEETDHELQFEVGSLFML